MPQRVGHASLGNLEVLHQKANGSTIVFTHCEQENEITWPTFPQMAAEIHNKCPTTVLVFFPFLAKFLKILVWNQNKWCWCFWYFCFGNWFHFQVISSFIATRRYLDQVTKKHLQTHKVQYFQPTGLENFQIEWPPKQNLHYSEGVKILLLCNALRLR